MKVDINFNEYELINPNGAIQALTYRDIKQMAGLSMFGDVFNVWYKKPNGLEGTIQPNERLDVVDGMVIRATFKETN